MTIENALARATEDAFGGCCSSPFVGIAVDCDRTGLHWQAGARRGEALDGDRADTPFRIASITKPFVAAAIHKLAEQGRLAIDDPLAGRLLPRTTAILKDHGYAPDTMMLGHLLTHTGGLPDHTETASYQRQITAAPLRRWTRHEQVELAACEADCVGSPGEYVRYSDTGYILLGEVVEEATGRNLADAVRQLLEFERHGLASTWWDILEPEPGNARSRAPLQVGQVDGLAVDPSFDLFGGGGLVSTVGDLNRFFKALLSGQILRPDSVIAALATPPAKSLPDQQVRRTHSYLLTTMPAGRHWALGHTGYWSSVAIRQPALGLSIALTFNSGDDEARAATSTLLGTVTQILENFGHLGRA